MNYLSILLEIKIILLTWGVLGRYIKKKTTKCCDFIRICSDYQNMTFKFIMGSVRVQRFKLHKYWINVARGIFCLLTNKYEFSPDTKRPLLKTVLYSIWFTITLNLFMVCICCSWLFLFPLSLHKRVN